MQNYITTPYVFVEQDEYIFNMLGYRREPLGKSMFSFLTYCKTAKSEKDLQSKYDINIIQEAIKKKYICDPTDIYSIHDICLIEIETTNYCNFKCSYCPVKFYPYIDKITMDMKKFTTILNQVKKAGVKNVTFNFFNEPTIDPFFEYRLREVKKYNLVLTLHTNGSNLSERIIRLLIEYKSNINMIRINIPSLNSDIYYRMTGFQLNSKLLDRIDSLRLSGIPIELVLNGTRGEINKNLPLFYEKYPRNIIFSIPSHDRAGILKNKYFQNVQVSGELFGCDRLLNTINVTTNGDVTICCNDYFKKYIIGNLLNNSLEEIMKSDKAQSIRKMVFGNDSPSDFLCRHCSYMLYICRNQRFKKINLV